MENTAAPKILIVEDEEDIVTLMKHNLESGGYKVDVCEDGVSALKSVRANPPTAEGAEGR